MKGKRLFIVGAALALAVSGCASATRLTRMNPLKEISNPDEEITFSEKGYSNQEVVSSVELEYSTITFDKGTNSNAPKYFTTGSAIRVYGGGTMTVASSTKTIEAIDLTFATGENTNAISTNVGTWDPNSWTGSASSITFTVGGTTGHRRIAGVKIKYASGGSNLENINLNKTSLELIAGESYQLTVSADEANWSSDDESVAMVENGFVSAIGGGQATITVSADGYNSATCSITVIDKITVARAREIAGALANKATTPLKYCIDGYIIGITEDWNNQFNNITFTLGDTADQTANLFIAYRSGVSQGTNTNGDELKRGDKVRVVGFLTNYNSTLEFASGCVTTLLEAGETPISDPTEVEVSEARTIALALDEGGQTAEKYITSGFISGITTAWDGSKLSYNLIDSIGGEYTLFVYKSTVDGETDGSALAQGDEVSVLGNLKKYNSNPQFVNCETSLINPGSNHPVNINDVDAESTNKTINQVKAYTAPDSSLIAKVTGVTDKITSDNYGNFTLVNPTNGDSIIVYGAYLNVTFQKAGDVYSVKTKTSPATSAIVGHVITVYGTIGYHDGAGQLVDALVVDSGTTAQVKASVSVNDSDMGSATLNAYSSIDYGSEISVSPVPAEGYQIKSVSVQNALSKETLEAPYKFNAQTVNEVFVEFEEIAVQPIDTYTVSRTISQVSGTTTNGTRVATLTLNDVVTVSVNPDGDNGKVYSAGAEWRLYQSSSAVVTVSVSSGYAITSIAFTYSVSNTGAFFYGETALTSETAVEIDSLSSAQFTVGNSGTATNGQVKITAISVTYLLVDNDNPSVYLNAASSVATLAGSENISEQSAAYTLSFEDSGLANDAKIENVYIGSVALNGDKGTNSNGNYPKYFDNGHEIRLYANNTITFSSITNISSISFVFSSGDTSKLSVPTDCGTLDENGWSGQENSVTFTNNSSSQVKITSISVEVEESLAISNVTLRFGAQFSKDTWDNMKAKFTIKDYGVMLFRRSPTSSTPDLTVEQAYTDGKALGVVRNGSGSDPYCDGANYAFNARIIFPDSTYFNVVYVAAPFVVIDDGTEGGKYYFLDEMEYSVKTLAKEYIGTDYQHLSQEALGVLAA